MRWLPSGGRILSVIRSMISVPTVPAVHEKVEQRTGKKQKERQPTQKMCAMFGKKIEGTDRQKAIKN